MEGVSRDSEKTVTDKAKIVELLKKSIDNVRAAAGAVTDADLNKKVKTYGDNEMTERQVLFRSPNHMHEHLGQSIAYARMNGDPPGRIGGDRPLREDRPAGTRIPPGSSFQAGRADPGGRTS